MNARTLKEKLVKGETVYGTFFQHAINPAMVDFLPEGALDFVIVTPEHTALDLAEFLPIRYALASKGIACLARTHSREPDDGCAQPARRRPRTCHRRRSKHACHRDSQRQRPREGRCRYPC